MSTILASIITSLLQSVISSLVSMYNAKKEQAQQLKLLTIEEYVKTLDEARADERKIVEASKKHNVVTEAKELTKQDVKFEVVTTPKEVVKNEKGEEVVIKEEKTTVVTNIKPDQKVEVNFDAWNNGK